MALPSSSRYRRLVEDEVRAMRGGTRRPGVTIAVVVSLVVAAVGAWLFVGSQRVVERTPTRLMLADGRRVVVRSFRAASARERLELQLRDPALAIVWSVPLGGRDIESLHAIDGGVLYRDGEALVVRELETGAVRWEATIEHPWEYDPHDELLVLDDGSGDLLEILEEAYGHGVMLRRRSLRTGTVSWTSEIAEARGDDGVRRWWYDGHLFLGSSHTAARFDLETGALDPLAPADAMATCFTTRESLYVDASTQLWLRPFGDDARRLGDLGGNGELRCARADGQIWVEWSAARGESDGDFDPRASVEPMPWPHAGPGSAGAAFVLTGDGTLVWGLRSGWGAPSFGIERPHEARAAFSPPRARPGRLVLTFVEGVEGGEEVGLSGGRSVDVVVDESTGVPL